MISQIVFSLIVNYIGRQGIGKPFPQPLPIWKNTKWGGAKPHLRPLSILKNAKWRGENEGGYRMPEEEM